MGQCTSYPDVEPGKTDRKDSYKHKNTGLQTKKNIFLNISDKDKVGGERKEEEVEFVRGDASKRME